MKTKMKRCLVPFCKAHGVTIRGLCEKCYSVASVLVHQKRTSWAKLEKQGKSLRAQKTNQGKTGWFLEGKK